MKIGLIVEDDSDAEVLKVIGAKILKRPATYSWFSSGGCGRMHAKCNAWAAALATRGCSLLVLAHDLDDHRVNELRQSLDKALRPVPVKKYVILVPTREIEAWLLADHHAIAKALRLSKAPKKQANPEAIRDPKKHLGALIEERSGKKLRYLNTVHNKKIAAAASLAALRRCTSFRPFETFLQSQLP